MAAILARLTKPPVEASREEKHAYATELSSELSVLMAQALRPRFKDVLPDVEGGGHESPTGSSEGKKRLDVKVWDDSLGLKLLVSIKTYSFRDWDGKKRTAGRYTKNVKRNGFELKDEADVIHRRQPYAVMVALMFVPMSACDDGDPNSTSDVQGVSSFASMVRRLRVRTGRAIDPDERRFDRFDLAEKLYIGLYEYDDEARRGALAFFDVASNPPRTGRPTPSSTVTLEQLVGQMEDLVRSRNSLSVDWDTLVAELQAPAEESD